MLFLLDLVHSDGRHETVRFDNETNAFFDKDGRRLSFKKKTEIPYRPYTPYYQPRLRNVRILTIQLGLKCNKDCEYCHQHGIKKTCPLPDFTPSDVPSFMERLSSSELSPKEIWFWGGEPLVYWKTLVKLIPPLRARFPNALMNFPTNGTLIDEDKVRFLERYNVGFTVSFGGSYIENGVRHSLLDNERVVMGLRQLRQGAKFQSILHKDFVPIEKQKEEIESKRIKIKLIGIHSVVRCNRFNKELADKILIPADKRSELEKFVYRVLCSQDQDANRIHDGLYRRFNVIKAFYECGVGIEHEYITADCSCPVSDGSDLTIDVRGNVLNCYNAPMYVLGNISIMDKTQPKDVRWLFQNHLFKNKCFCCPYVTACGSVCPLVHDENSPEFIATCHNKRIQAAPFFKKSVEMLFGSTLKMIEEFGTQRVLREFDY